MLSLVGKGRFGPEARNQAECLDDLLAGVVAVGLEGLPLPRYRARQAQFDSATAHDVEECGTFGDL